MLESLVETRPPLPVLVDFAHVLRGNHGADTATKTVEAFIVKLTIGEIERFDEFPYMPGSPEKNG